MGDLAELLLGLFWDGAMTSAKGQWLPRPVRILAGGLLLLVFLGLAGLLLLVGIAPKNRDWPCWGSGSWRYPAPLFSAHTGAGGLPADPAANSLNFFEIFACIFLSFLLLYHLCL